MKVEWKAERSVACWAFRWVDWKVFLWAAKTAVMTVVLMAESRVVSTAENSVVYWGVL